MAILLGIDIGTTSTIGMLIDSDGRQLALASRPVALSSLRPGWAEEDPEDWWSNLCALCPELLSKAGVDKTDIAGIGVAGMLPATVLLDGEGGLLRPSIQQSDGRVGAEVDAILALVDSDEFIARTGNGINQQLIATKLRWLRAHEPDVMSRARTVLGSYDYINYRLTGHLGVERNWALEAGFIDLASGEIADDLVALGDVDPRLVPPAHQGHQIIGKVTKAAASATGLQAGTPVIGGAADHIASAYVAGVQSPGDLLLKFGGAGDIMLSTAEPKPDPRMFLDYHIMPGLFMPNGCMAASGSILNWIVSTFADRIGADTEKSPHARLDDLAAATPAGAAGLVMLPYMLGEKTPIHDPAARGTLIGLGLHHDIGHVWRAALEGIVLGFRHNVETFEAIGYPVSRVIASDGGARSPLWMQIAADAIGQPVQLLQGHPGSCLGSAFIAALAIGARDDWEGVVDFVQQGSIVDPTPDNRAVYDDAYGIYRETYQALQPLYPRLGRLGAQSRQSHH